MLKKKLLPAIVLSLVMFITCSCTKPGEKIIEVNDHPITKSEFNKTFDKAVNDSMFAKMGIDVKKMIFVALLNAQVSLLLNPL